MKKSLRMNWRKFIPIGLSQRSIESGMRLKLGHEVQQKTQTYLNTKIDTNEFTNKAVISSILYWLKEEGFEDSHVKLICEDDNTIVKLHIGIEW